MFSQDTCLSYFRSTCDSSNQTYCGLPDWVSEVMPCSEIDTEFDSSTITPGQVKRKCPSSSSPGTDQNTYLHLRNLPSTHYFLAALFTKILLETHSGPPSWFSAEITLIPKGGDPSNPKNFRPIAMSSVIPKLFHKLKS